MRSSTLASWPATCSQVSRVNCAPMRLKPALAKKPYSASTGVVDAAPSAASRGRGVGGQLEAGAAGGGVGRLDRPVAAVAAGLVVGDHQRAVGAAVDAVDLALKQQHPPVGQSDLRGLGRVVAEAVLGGDHLRAALDHLGPVGAQPLGQFVTLA